ncbi:hypothetical protein TCAL_16088 [Tigriopus californicus]|uniref:Uncharacterized protein n=1 Tax=Tigriopus californicus TaxID=6832 RepID=A0A553PNP1_TIGCA|nr:hypothetical protein TCAL_16088 [Tigriopus californicus]
MPPNWMTPIHQPQPPVCKGRSWQAKSVSHGGYLHTSEEEDRDYIDEFEINLVFGGKSGIFNTTKSHNNPKREPLQATISSILPVFFGTLLMPPRWFPRLVVRTLSCTGLFALLGTMPRQHWIISAVRILKSYKNFEECLLVKPTVIASPSDIDSNYTRALEHPETMHGDKHVYVRAAVEKLLDMPKILNNPKSMRES